MKLLTTLLATLALGAATAVSEHPATNSWTLESSLNWATAVDYDLYLSTPRAHIDPETPEGDGFSLNHDAHPGCRATPVPPEMITGQTGSGGRHELGSVRNCGVEVETTFEATVTVTKPIAINGRKHNPGDTFTPELNVGFMVDAKQGISTNRDTRRQLDCLVREGQEFVFRYYVRSTQQPEKRLTFQEAAQISNAGMLIAVVFQQRAQFAEDFSREDGVRDGEYAYNYALFTIHQPVRTAIYFAVDYDADDDDITGVITEYFEGVLEGFNNVSNEDPIYHVGVYGSGAVCDALLSTGKVEFTWRGLSSGWRGFNTFMSWDVKQLREERICGLQSSEPCISRGDFGGFQLE